MFFIGLFIGSALTAYGFTYRSVNPAIVTFVARVKDKLKPKA